MTEELKLIKDYRKDDPLRTSFNTLSKSTFDLDFEDWYRNGYWTDKYNPYSIVMDNKVVANVSVNRMEFESDGKIRKYLQLGTVMVDPKYRHQGLIRRLMLEVEKDYLEKVDGIYLFANDSVVRFYPKFGYRTATEYRYTKEISRPVDAAGVAGATQASLVRDHPYGRPVAMNHKEDWATLEEAIDRSAGNSAFDMKNNKGLIMFYVTKFMQSNVYFVESEGAYVIAEIEDADLFLHAIYSPEPVHPDTIIEAFGEGIRKVTFGFTPLNYKDYQFVELNDENTTLFVKGRGFDWLEQKKYMFPTLSFA